MKISKSELEALESGDSWYDGDIFKGKIPWKIVYNTNHYELSGPEKYFLKHTVDELLDIVDNEYIHNNGYIPAKIWNFLKEKRFFGLCIGPEHGGLGFSHLLHSRVVEKISTHSIPVAITTMVPNSLGPGELIHKYGTDNQKSYYLPRLADGTDIPCFGLTSTNAGSDAEGSQDSYGVVTKNGNILLTFEKRYITLAPVATLIGLAFKLYDPDHIWGDKTELGMTIALLPKNLENMHIGDMLNPLDVPFENGTILGKKVLISTDYILGDKAGIGTGWKMLVECLGIGRSISLPSLSSGMAKKILHHTTHYGLRRKQFGTSILNFEGVEDKLADMIIKTHMIDVMKDMTLGALGLGLNPSVLSALGKYNTTEMARDVVNHGMDITAGSSIILGERNKIARYYQVAPVGITVEGANILTKNLISFGQGMMKNHPYAFTEVRALMAKDKVKLVKTALKHMLFFFKNVLKLTATLPVHKYAYEKKLDYAATEFAFLTDILMVLYRGNLKKKEYISGRMGEIFSKIYIGIAIQKHTISQKNPDGSMDIVASKYAMAQLLFDIHDIIIDICDNIGFGWIIKKFLMPFGNPYKKPSDNMKKELVKDYISSYDSITYLFDILYDKDKPLVGLGKKPPVFWTNKKSTKLRTIYDYENSEYLREGFVDIITDHIKRRHESLMVDHNGDKSMYDEHFKDLDMDLRS